MLKFSIKLVEYNEPRIAGGKSMKVSRFGILSRFLINLG
ncbi:hypothetical protein CUZ96_2810 [Enterococcus lactis]|nr:hypothetical protein [Enterococcus lactis]